MHEDFAAFCREWQDFVGRRFKEDMTLMRRLSSATSPLEFWNAQTAFWQKAVEDYWQEYGRMASLACGFMTTSLTAAQRGMEEAAVGVLPLPRAA
jgi:hypothetical protein